MKAGVFAFIAFWVLLGSALTQAVSIARQARDPFLLTVATCTAVFPVMFCAFAYVDLGIGSFRLMVLLGLFIGALGPLRRLLESEELSERAVEPVAPLGSKRPGIRSRTLPAQHRARRTTRRSAPRAEPRGA
jgi:hypothetical protein